MERFFLFCFRSCLKGENDNELYTVLEISDPSSATTETIKKAYKKRSLSLHPDKLAQRGIEVTAEHKQEFLKVKEAYNVLSDPKRRKIYDELGSSGLKLMENPSEVDPTVLLRNYQKNRGDRMMLVLVVLLVFAALLILPILFSLKCDGTLGDESPWVAIWTPMWIVDAAQLAVATYMLCHDGSDSEKSKNGDDADDDREKEEEEEKIPLADRVFNFISTMLFVLIQIFIGIRLDGYTRWSWFKVFIPWLLYETANIIYESKLAFFTAIPQPDYSNIALANDAGEAGGEEDAFMQKIELESRYFDQIMKQKAAQKKVLVHLLRIWLALFLATQLEDHSNWNWGLVLLPIWVYLFMQFAYAIGFRIWAAQKTSGLDAEAILSGEETDPINMVKFQQGGTLSATSTWTCISQIAPLFMAVLLVSRLDATFISTFVIILPIFLVLGCCCCAVFCGVCCLSCINMDGLEEEMRQARGEHDADAATGGADGGGEGGATGTGEGAAGSDLESGSSRSGGGADEGNIGELKKNYKPPVAPVQKQGDGGSESGGSTKTPLRDFSPTPSAAEQPPADTSGIDVDID